MGKRNNTRYKKDDALWVWLGLLVSLSVMFWSTWLASQNKLFPGELELLVMVYDFSDRISNLMLFVSNVGTIIIFAATAIYLEFKHRLTLLLRLFLGGVITVVVTTILKIIVSRGRPEALLNLESRELFTLASQGFPSGHTAVSAVIVLTLLPFLPKKYWVPLLVVPFLVGLSRMALGVHLPLDVIGGLAIGALIAIGVQLSTTTEVFVRQHKRLASRIKKA